MTVFVRDNGLEGIERELEFIDVGSFDEHFAELFLMREQPARILATTPKRLWRAPELLIDFHEWLCPDEYFVRQNDSNCAHISVKNMGVVYFYRLNSEMWKLAPPDVMLPVYRQWKKMYRKSSKLAYARSSYLVNAARREIETEYIGDDDDE
jgi:hypothetical protein